MVKNPPAKSRLFSLLLSFVIVLAGFIILSQRQSVSGSSPISQPQVWPVFSSSVHGFSFSYPPGWEILETQKEVSIIEPGSGYGFTIMAINNFPKPEKYLQDLEKTQNFAVESESSIKIGNLDTLALVDHSAGHSQYMLYSLQGKKLITMVFLSDQPGRLITIAKILSTFRLLP